MDEDATQTTLADCPRCGRQGLPGVVDPGSQHVMLRRHRTIDVPGRGGGVPIRNGRRQVDAGHIRFIRGSSTDEA